MGLGNDGTKARQEAAVGICLISENGGCCSFTLRLAVYQTFDVAAPHLQNSLGSQFIPEELKGIFLETALSSGGQRPPDTRTCMMEDRSAQPQR